MKRLAPALILASSLLASSMMGGAAHAASSSWTVDSEESSATFGVKHLGLSTERGRLGPITGTLTYDDRDVTLSTVEVSIDVKGINTGEEKRDNHLRSDAFFDVEHYPNITFTSTKVARGAKGKLKVTGDLTIRGKTKPVVLDVDFTGEQVTAYHEKLMAAAATTRINRQDFGVSWNSTVDSGGLLVSDEVAITLDMAFKMPAADTPAPAASSAAAVSPAAAASPTK